MQNLFVDINEEKKMSVLLLARVIRHKQQGSVKNKLIFKIGSSEKKNQCLELIIKDVFDTNTILLQKSNQTFAI